MAARPEIKRLAVFVSGQGSNFRSIQQAMDAGDITGRFALLVTNDPHCPAAGYAREIDIPVLKYPGPDISPSELLAAMQRKDIDYGILAGYVKMVPTEIVAAYPRRILNIHPALLPKYGGRGFYGQRVHAAVLASDDTVTGATVHFVDKAYDHGHILAQVEVPVLPDDTVATLARRVLSEEHRLYPRVIAILCRDEIRWTANGRPDIQSPELAYPAIKTGGPA